MRYLLFGGERYYASGGGNDYIGTSDSINDLTNKGESLIGARSTNGLCVNFEWWHVFDSDSCTTVATSDYKPYGSDELPSWDIISNDKVKLGPMSVNDGKLTGSIEVTFDGPFSVSPTDSETETLELDFNLNIMGDDND